MCKKSKESMLYRQPTLVEVLEFLKIKKASMDKELDRIIFWWSEIGAIHEFRELHQNFEKPTELHIHGVDIHIDNKTLEATINEQLTDNIQAVTEIWATELEKFLGVIDREELAKKKHIVVDEEGNNYVEGHA